MATLATIHGYVDSAIAAMESGDWTTARTKLMQAKAGLSVLPDQGQGGDQLRYDRNAIDDLIAQCEREIASSSISADGIRKSKFVFDGVSRS